jgi:hypothetical protein
MSRGQDSERIESRDEGGDYRAYETMSCMRNGPRVAERFSCCVSRDGGTPVQWLARRICMTGIKH